jgi:hypothetical protein
MEQQRLNQEHVRIHEEDRMVKDQERFHEEERFVKDHERFHQKIDLEYEEKVRQVREKAEQEIRRAEWEH